MGKWCLSIYLRRRSVLFSVQYGVLIIFLSDGFDWTPVKASVSTALEVIPFYPASSANKYGTDGLFQWNAWPSENNQPINSPMTTDGDKE